MNKHLGSSFESYLAQQPPTVWYLPKVDAIAVATKGGVMVECGYIYDWGSNWLDILIDAGAVYIGEL
jgi:hypothetical protein